jgi:AraC-like DNA-binding protein/CheY-like chemotaxis protein
VRGDRTRLRQVALNLLSNAVKFTDRGAIGLELSADTIQATVAIHDTGLGIPLNDQQRIFDEFRSSERTADRGYGGLGLGLAICKQLIERHGGTISVYSSGQEDGGATFRFSLPLLAAHILEPVDDQEPILARRRVVVLHEHAPIDDGLSALLDQRGFAVEMERVDADADWLPRLIAVPPAALILDAALATRRGWEIIGMLKRHPATTRLPVLMYALDGHNERGSLLELDYRLKPLDPEQLTQVLEFQRTWDDQPSGTTTILVVDDDPDTLALHTRLVEQHLPESRVIQARNGREALAVMEQIRPNLVLLDLMMPQLDGFGVLEAMRAHEATRDVPVVVLTAHMLTDTDVAHLNAGVASLLSKGLFTANEIVGHIEAALVRQRKLGSTMQGIVRRAVAYIHTHYAASITRDQLAAQVGVSADHLTASFRQDMGITPIAYLNRYRISRARTLLEESSRSVTDIALSSGFTDPAHFSRLFHREVGMSPNAYRRAKQH